MSPAEAIFLGFIRAGDMVVTETGRIYWRPNLLPCKPAEHRLPHGYLQIRKMVKGKRHHALAHRIVWIFFNGEIPGGMQINHKNGVKDDNRPENLEVVTPSGNLSHAHRTGLLDQRGQRNPAAKLTDRQVAEIRLAYAEGGVTQSALGEKYGVSFQTISKVVRGDRRTAQAGKTADYTARRQHDRVIRDPESQRFVGTKAAGRLLDGVLHDAVPEA